MMLLSLMICSHAIMSTASQSVPGLDYIEIFKTAPRKESHGGDVHDNLVSESRRKEYLETVEIEDFSDYDYVTLVGDEETITTGEITPIQNGEEYMTKNKIIVETLDDELLETNKKSDAAHDDDPVIRKRPQKTITNNNNQQLLSPHEGKTEKEDAYLITQDATEAVQFLTEVEPPSLLKKSTMYVPHPSYREYDYPVDSSSRFGYPVDVQPSSLDGDLPLGYYTSREGYPVGYPFDYDYSGDVRLYKNYQPNTYPHSHNRNHRNNYARQMKENYFQPLTVDGSLKPFLKTNKNQGTDEVMGQEYVVPTFETPSAKSLEMAAKQRAYKEAEARYYKGLNEAINKSDLLRETVRMIENGELDELFKKGKIRKKHEEAKLKIKGGLENNTVRLSKTIAHSPNVNHRSEEISTQNYRTKKATEVHASLAMGNGFHPHPLYKNLQKLPDYSEKSDSPLAEKIENMSNEEKEEYVKLYIPVRAKAVKLQELGQVTHHFDTLVPKINYETSRPNKFTTENIYRPQPTTYRPKVKYVHEEDLARIKPLLYHTKSMTRNTAYPYPKPYHSPFHVPLYHKKQQKFYLDPVLNPKYIETFKSLSHSIKTNKEITHEKRTTARPKRSTTTSSYPSQAQLDYNRRVVPSSRPTKINGRRSRHLNFEKAIESNVRFPRYGYDIDQYFGGFPQFGFFTSTEEQ